MSSSWVVGILAAVLASCQPGRLFIDVDFGDMPPALVWAPNCTVVGTSAHDRTVHITARAGETSVLRLFRRYRDKHYLLAPSTPQGISALPGEASRAP